MNALHCWERSNLELSLKMLWSLFVQYLATNANTSMQYMQVLLFVYYSLFCSPVSSVVLVCALLSLLSASHACPKECSCNSNTKVVDCRGQGLYDIPRRLHPDTQELYLQDNRIRGLGSMAFREIPLVRILDLSNNSITSVSPTALLGLRTLQRLSLAHNSLRELDKRLLGSIRSLSHLDLSHNR